MAYFEFGGEKGVARATAELCLRLARKGHTVEFHCTHPPVHSPHPQIRFRRVLAVNSFSALGIFSFCLTGSRSLRRFSYDVTHTHGNIIGSDVITAHSCHKAALHVARSHPQRDDHVNLGIADAIRLFLEKKNYGERRFKKLIAVSAGVKRELVEMYCLGETDIHIIPNGVDLERFHPELRNTVGSDTRVRLGIPANEVVVIFVANEFGRKGLACCIDALSLLGRKSPTLLVVGNDRQEAYRGQAQKRGVLDRVVFCGSVRQIEQYYAASDIFLLPTFYEAFSLATLEAAASGLPLLVTKVNGTEELVEEGRNGYFVQRNADDIAYHLRRLVEDERLRKSLSLGARMSVAPYSWDEIANRTIRVYEEVR